MGAGVTTPGFKVRGASPGIVWGEQQHVALPPSTWGHGQVKRLWPFRVATVAEIDLLPSNKLSSKADENNRKTVQTV